MTVWLARYLGVTQTVHHSKESALKACEKSRKKCVKISGQYVNPKNWTVQMKRVRFT